MSAVRSRVKRWFKVLGVACLVVVVIALALPVWFPWVLRPGLAHFGVGFDAYERIGYTQFALTNVRAEFPNARFDSKRIVGSLPPRWLWRRYSRGSDEEPLLTVTAWNLQIQPGGMSPRTSASSAPDSVFAVAEEINGKLPAWRSWLPAAQLTDGKVHVGSYEVRLTADCWHCGNIMLSGPDLQLSKRYVL